MREELALHQGPSAADGSPTWSLQDPVRNLFFRIDWLTFEILSRWHLGDPKMILSAVDQETTIEPQPDDFEEVLRFLADNELLQRPGAQGTAWYLEQRKKRSTSPLSWLLHRYLFFRIPLWRPDAWLSATSALVSPFYSRIFFIVTAMALLLGLIEVSRQWQGFLATLIDTFTWQGMFGYLVALVLVKFLHELGHAYTAKRYGCRVPTMGVAFLVLFPMAYTDVNEAWKIRDKADRLRVGAAGIATELILAVWALLAWALLPEGYFKGAAFLLATTTWISTLVINASPFLRFDGYFLLMDWLNLPNLHQRAFALGKWQLRECLFGLGEPPPEYYSRRRQRGLIVFAWLTWLYRLIVFFGIAVLVYTLFPKPVGPFLAAVELAWFIGIPVLRELGEWKKRIMAIVSSRRTWLFLMLCGLLVLSLILPWDPRIRASGVLRPAEHSPVFAPGPARIDELFVTHGSRVNAGDTLMILHVPDLNFRQQALSVQLATLRQQENVAGLSPELREQQSVLNSQRIQKETELAALASTAQRYRPVAPVGGRFFYHNPDLSRDWWVAENEPLGTISNDDKWQVETYLTEAELGRINTGDRARFYSETPKRTILPLTVARIDQDATRALPDAILASTRGGDILVRETTRGLLIPETAIYRVVLVPSDSYEPDEPLIQRGRLVLFGRPKAHLHEFARAAAALIVRESGF